MNTQTLVAATQSEFEAMPIEEKVSYLYKVIADLQKRLTEIQAKTPTTETVFGASMPIESKPVHKILFPKSI